MSENRIVVVGSSNTDMIIKASRIPRPGETILGGEFRMAAGGKGANQAVAAARAGGNVVFIARVGDDLFGEQAVEGFRLDGIDVSCVIRDSSAPSGIALICVDQNGENSISVASGANARLSSEDVLHARDLISSADILLMQLEVPLETVLKAAVIAREKGVRVILNPAPARPLSSELLECVSILTPNESEAELLTGVAVVNDASALRASQSLMDRGVETVLITLGAHGAFLASKAVHELIAGYKVQAVDTTAAGDVFSGSLAVALAEGKGLQDAVRFANAAAALSVTQMGAQPSVPRRKEIEEFLAAHQS